MYYKICFYFIFTFEAEERYKRKRKIFIKNNFYTIIATSYSYLLIILIDNRCFGKESAIYIFIAF